MAKALYYRHKAGRGTRTSKTLAEGSISTGKSGTSIGVWDRFSISVRGEVDGRVVSVELEFDRKEAEHTAKYFVDMLKD